jgi:hypothetical protein
MRRRSACNSSRSRGFASGGTRSYLFGCICLSLCLKIQNITLKKIVQLTYSPLAGIIIIIIIIIIICYRKPDPSSFAAIGVFPPFSFTHFIPLSLPAFVGVRPRENRQRNRK